MTSLSKMSKRQKKEFYAQQRGSWHGLCPVTRTVQSGKLYSRSKLKREMMSLVRGAGD